MLLSYNKSVKASSQKKNYPITNIVDENLKSYWVAEKNDSTQWVEIDLESISNVYAIQLNFFDFEEKNLWGRMPDLYQRYWIESSLDGKKWETIADYKNSYKDAPHNYIELDKAIKTRFIRYRHLHIPNKHLAMGDIRIFGIENGNKPSKVKNLTIVRDKDTRNTFITWDSVKNAQGYNVLWGISPDKLYNSYMIYKNKGTTLELRSLNKNQKYYFAIEAFNENGISERIVLNKAY